MAELNGSPVTLDALQSLGLVNYGHFTSMRVDDHCIRGLSKHLDRLANDCREIFGIGLDRSEVREYLKHAIAGCDGSFVARVTVFDPDADLGRPGMVESPSILITIRPAGQMPASPMTVQSVTYRRDIAEVKHVGLFGALRCRRSAQLNGFDDALLIDSSSFVYEGATWNVGFFDGDRVVWPSAQVLPGVTMRLLKQVHENSVTSPVKLRDLSDMQAVFATNTSIGVRPITKVDDLSFPAEHEIFDILQKEYEEIPAEDI